MGANHAVSWVAVGCKLRRDSSIRVCGGTGVQSAGLVDPGKGKVHRNFWGRIRGAPCRFGRRCRVDRMHVPEVSPLGASERPRLKTGIRLGLASDVCIASSLMYRKFLLTAVMVGSGQLRSALVSCASALVSGRRDNDCCQARRVQNSTARPHALDSPAIRARFDRIPLRYHTKISSSERRTCSLSNLRRNMSAGGDRIGLLGKGQVAEVGSLGPLKADLCGYHRMQLGKWGIYDIMGEYGAQCDICSSTCEAGTGNVCVQLPQVESG